MSPKFLFATPMDRELPPEFMRVMWRNLVCVCVCVCVYVCVCVVFVDDSANGGWLLFY